MQTMGISQFKSHALKILDQVAKTKEIIKNTNSYDEILLYFQQLVGGLKPSLTKGSILSAERRKFYNLKNGFCLG